MHHGTEAGEPLARETLKKDGSISMHVQQLSDEQLGAHSPIQL